MFLLDLGSYSLRSLGTGIVVDSNTASRFSEFQTNEFAKPPEACVSF